MNAVDYEHNHLLYINIYEKIALSLKINNCRLKENDILFIYINKIKAKSKIAF